MLILNQQLPTIVIFIYNEKFTFIQFKCNYKTHFQHVAKLNPVCTL